MARSAWASARGERVRARRRGTAERGDHEGVRFFVELKGAGLAGAADDAAGRAGEADEVVSLAAGGAAGQMWREARGEQELQAEGERVGAAGAGRVALEQGELVGEQVIDAGVRFAVVEDAGDGLARPGGAVERARACSRRRGCAAIVSTEVTVSRSLRPS